MNSKYTKVLLAYGVGLLAMLLLVTPKLSYAQADGDIRIETVYEDQGVLYAGNNASFTAVEYEYDGTLFTWDEKAINTSFWYNLILSDGTLEWLLDAKDGSAVFNGVQIPSFVTPGDYSVEIRASDVRMGTIGGLIGYTVSPLTSGFLAGDHGSEVSLVTDEAHDLTNLDSVEFWITIPDEELAGLHKLKLEYSVDGKETFTEIRNYPNSDHAAAGNYSESVAIPEAAKTEATYLRWRVEQYHSSYDFNVWGITLSADEVDYDPRDVWEYVGHDFTPNNLSRQRIDVISTDALEYCLGSVVELTYRVKGTFSDDYIIQVQGSDGGIVWGDFEEGGAPVIFSGVTSGEGVLELDPIDGDPPTATDLQIRLIAIEKDHDGEDLADITGESLHLPIKFVEEIDEASIDLSSADDVTCADAERVVTIEGVQENFRYQLQNYLTGETVGDAVVANPDDDDLTDNTTYPYYNTGADEIEIMIGALDSLLVLEVQVTAMDKAGTIECEQLVPDVQLELDVRPLYTLHYDLDNTGVFEPVADDQEFVICEGFTGLEFRMGYWKDGNFVDGSARWFRDNQQKIMDEVITFSNFTITDTYYAVYTDTDGCGEYHSDSVNVSVAIKPAQPTITADGSTELCEDGTVTLTADEGYAYYRWFKDGMAPADVVGSNTQSIVVEESGAYRVQVSDAPWGHGCYSDEFSDPVYVDIFEFDDNITFLPNEIDICPGDSIAMVEVINTQDGVTYYLVNDATGEDFMSFSVSDGGAGSFLTLPIYADASYSLRAVNDENTDCSKMLPNSQKLTITVLPVFQPLVQLDLDGYWSVPGDESYCSSNLQVRLGADDPDNQFGLYTGTVEWFKDGAYYDNTAIIFGPEPGSYTAKWTLDDKEQCAYTTDPVEVAGKPARPVITPNGPLNVCRGEGGLTLSAPEGFEEYIWTGGLHNVSSDDNEFNVVRLGTNNYTVSVVNESGCESDPSLPITASVFAKPDKPEFEWVDNIICGANYASLYAQWFTPQDDVMYQIYDVATGEPSGEARFGAPSMFLESDVLTRDALLEVRASRVDVEGCTQRSEPIEVYVANLTILVSGNVLSASLPDFDPVIPGRTATSYQWYRNGSMIMNGGQDRSISIYDDAEYSVAVTTQSGCILESTIDKQSKQPEEQLKDASKTLALYPNPATDNVTVLYNSKVQEDVTIKILSVRGDVVYQRTVSKLENELQHSINIENIANGSYIIHVTGQQDRVEIQQFIKF